MLHADAPLSAHDALTAWTADPVIIGGLAAFAVIYARGRAGRRQSLWFVLGWTTLALALLSPLHAFSEVLFSVHMLQHTLLICVAAPLLAAAQPGLALVRAAPRAWRRKVAAVQQALHISPLAAFLAHGAAIWVWHVPSFYGATLSSNFMHALQHISFIATAIIFWMAILDVRTRRVSYGSGILYVFGTAVHTTMLGALITLAPSVIYVQYLGAEQFGLSALTDQQLAGLIMWVPAALLYTGSALVLLLSWLEEAERRVTTSYARVLRSSTAPGLLLLALTACDMSGQTVDSLSHEAAASATGGRPSRAPAIIESFGCGGCHTIEGVRGADGLVGPPLSGIATRGYIAGVLPNSPGNLIRWIRDPQAVDPLTAMPTLGVSEQQARDIAAYLYTLD